VIRQNQWLVKGDRIGIVSGLPGSDALYLFLMHLLARRSDTRIIRINLPQLPGDRGSVSWYQTLSRVLSDSGATRVALADCSEDIAEQILFHIFTGNTEALLSSDIPGLKVPFMQPFREIPHEELRIYYRFHSQGKTEDMECHSLSPGSNTILLRIHSLLGDYTSLHPSAPHALRTYRDILRELMNADEHLNEKDLQVKR
jgi:tRNA(Ile)-lysidine synthase TilS/MesJ